MLEMEKDMSWQTYLLPVFMAENLQDLIFEGYVLYKWGV